MSELKKASHIPALDGLRGLAILLVMVYHFCQLYAPADGFLDQVLFGAAASGWCGVDLFFVLSGFLITGILFDAKGSSRYLRNFWMRRILRIFPLYYATVFAFFVVLPAIPHALAQDYTVDAVAEQGWFWAHLTNIKLVMREDWYSHLVPNVFWSLAIEEQFYLVWPLIVLCLCRRTLMVLCGILFVFALVARLLLDQSPVGLIMAYVLPFARMDALVMGGFLALWVRGPNGIAGAVRFAKPVMFATAASLFIMGVQDGGLHWQRRIVCTVGFSLVALMFGGLLLMVARARPGTLLHRVFVSRFMTTFGKYSYALYLFHGPAGSIAKRIYNPADGAVIFGSHVPRTLLYIALASVICLTISWLSWNLLEKHCLKLKRFFENKRAPAPPEAAPAPEERAPVGSA